MEEFSRGSLGWIEEDDVALMSHFSWKSETFSFLHETIFAFRGR